MARTKVKSGDIGGYTYEVVQLGATAGLRMSAELIKILAPSLGALAGNADLTGGIKSAIGGHLKPKALEDAARALASSLDSTKVQAIVKELADTTEIWGPGFGDAGAPLSMHFDDHFAGKYVNLGRWLAFALKVNFSDFFDGLSGMQGQPSPLPVAQPSRSRST